MADISKIALPDGNTYDIKNDAVKQTRDIESDGAFDVLFSNTTLDSSKTDSARIDYRFTYNPAAGRMSVNKISSLSEVRTPNVKGLHFYSGSTLSDLLFENSTDGLTFGSYFLDALKPAAGITALETALNNKYGYSTSGATVDLNSLTDNGFYSYYNPTNRPYTYNAWAQLLVIRVNNLSTYVIQICITNTQTPYIYIRVLNNGTWYSWRKFTTTAV